MNFYLFIISYIIGAIPFNYIIIKLLYSKNISEEGSGNVGTLNAIRVSGNKFIGVAVLLFDILKAILVILIAKYIFEGTFPQVLIAAIAVMLAHKFNILLKFKGGIGLAPAFGVIIMFNYLLVVLWGLIWIIFKIKLKNMDFSIILASSLCIIAIIFIPESIFSIFNSFILLGIAETQIIFTVISLLILLSPGLYRGLIKPKI